MHSALHELFLSGFSNAYYFAVSTQVRNKGHAALHEAFLNGFVDAHCHTDDACARIKAHSALFKLIARKLSKVHFSVADL